MSTLRYEQWGYEAVHDILTSDRDAAYHAERAKGIGGSDATIISNGDWQALNDLFLLKVGKREPEDLSDVLPVAMGKYTEPLNAYWFEKETGYAITHRNRLVLSPQYGFMRATIDGLVNEGSKVIGTWEGKHVNAFWKTDDLVQKYMPQCQHNMHVAGVKTSYLSAFFGNMKWEVVEIELDEWYIAQLIDREREFWRYVKGETDEPAWFGRPMDQPKTPVDPAKLRTVDMAGNNEWPIHAGAWLENKAAAAKFKKAGEGLKKLVDDDVGEAHGSGVMVTRAKNGALTVRVKKED